MKKFVSLILVLAIVSTLLVSVSAAETTSGVLILYAACVNEERRHNISLTANNRTATAYTQGGEDGYEIYARAEIYFTYNGAEEYFHNWKSSTSSDVSVSYQLSGTYGPISKYRSYHVVTLHVPSGSSVYEYRNYNWLTINNT